MTARPPPTVLALGGNALIRPGEQGSPAEQAVRVQEVAPALVDLALREPLVLTHGNGPQVGRLLLRSDLLREQVPPTTLDLAVAATQGEIGWMLMLALQDELRQRGSNLPVVGLLTRVQVDLADPDFQSPSKFVGAFYDEATALDLAATYGWRVRPDGDRGWRRVVPSPAPLAIPEAASIRQLSDQGALVIACGGGGVPFVDLGDRRAAVEAVVDKDLASALLACQLRARRLVILTGVDKVWRDFGKPGAHPIERIGREPMGALLREGQFPPGSMGPKIEAALRFLDQGGEEVLITSPEALPLALEGREGTRIHA